MEGYEALASYDGVNVVYVGTINTTHLSIAKVINAGIPRFNYNIKYR